MKYYMQTQAPAGNWVDSIGSSSLKSLREHAAYAESKGEKTRIIERADKVVSAAKIAKNPLPALASLLKSHAASVGGHRGAKRRRVMTPRRVAPSGSVMKKNPSRRKVKTGAIASPERIALQLQFQGQWLTVKYFPVSPAGNAAAKKLAQSMHKKKGFPMRAITAAV